MSQLSFADAEYAGKRKKTRREVFLEEMEQVVPWKVLLKIIVPHYPVAGRGRRPYALESMLRVHLIRNGFALSHRAMEKALYQIAALRAFARLRLSEPIPNEATILNQAFNPGWKGGICKVMQIAPSTYWLHAQRQARPELRPERAKRDDVLAHEVRHVCQANMEVCGVRKVWRQLHLERLEVARCIVSRLMRRQGLQGAVRGKKLRTTMPDPAAARSSDKVQRAFYAERPKQLWVSDFTYVSASQGFVYVALVTDVCARRIVGWRVSFTMRTDFVVDALEQALYERRLGEDGGPDREREWFRRQPP